MKHYPLIFLLALMLAGCAQEQPQPQSLVLEGWIDAGGYPVVLIHKSLVLKDTPKEIRNIEQIVEDQLIPFGRVAVSDGEQEVVLTGRLDTTYMPPYTYSSVYLTGQPGRTYTVTAKYRDLYATATTTIPSVATLDSLAVSADGLGRVSVTGYMSGINAGTDSYYALFLREFGKLQFRLCPLGVFEGKNAVNGRMELTVKNTERDSTEDNYGYYFHRDTIRRQVKLAHIDYASYRFWQAYNEQQMTRGIVFMPIYKNIQGNVNGGIGCFTGMGSSVYTFSTARDTTYTY